MSDDLTDDVLSIHLEERCVNIGSSPSILVARQHSDVGQRWDLCHITNSHELKAASFLGDHTALPCSHSIRFGNGDVWNSIWCTHLSVRFTRKRGSVQVRLVPGDRMKIGLSKKMVSWHGGSFQPAEETCTGHSAVNLLEEVLEIHSRSNTFLPRARCRFFAVSR